MKLTEILDSKVDYKVIKDTTGFFHAESMINGRKIGVFFYRLQGDNWDFTFAERRKTYEEFWSHALSGKGGELQVFSLVKKLILDMLEKHKPSTLECSASKSDKNKAGIEHRIRLYEKLLKQIPNYTLERRDDGSKVIFVLVRK